MLAKHLPGLALAFAIGPFCALSADASARFTVQNALKSDVDLYIYYGGDTYCGAHEQHKKLSASKSRTFDCSSNGKCQIALFINNQEVCKSDRNACSKSTIKIKDGSKVTLRKTRRNKYYCDFE